MSSNPCSLSRWRLEGAQAAKLFNKHPLPAVFTITSYETYHFERRESLELGIGEWAAPQINPALDQDE